MSMTRQEQIDSLQREWKENPRWKDITRGYSAEDVVRLRGSVQPELTYAARGARKLWAQVHGAANKGYVNCLGALTAGQAVQQAKAGVEAIYLSGWQVAADNNTSETMYPTSRCMRATRCRRWCGASTTLSRAPTRFNGSAASGPATTDMSTTSCPSSPTPRPDSAAS